MPNRTKYARTSPAKSKKLLFLTVAVVIVGIAAALIALYTTSTPVMSKNYHASIETNFGEIEIQLYGDQAPVTVENFVNLAKSGFYEGTLFHRVVPGFVIQGGDPNTKLSDRSVWGKGGSGRTIPLEISSLQNVRGMVAMARSQDPNSASSQFYILVGDAPHLDGQYAVFGKVVSGMEVVDKIASVPTDDSDIPLENVVIERVTISERT